MKAYTRTDPNKTWKLRDNIVDIQAPGWKGAIEGPNGWHPDSMYIILPEIGPGDLVSIAVRGQHMLLFGSNDEVVIRPGDKISLKLRDDSADATH